MQEDYEVAIEWRGFQLHPEIPAGGVRADDYFGADRVRHRGDRLQRFAAEFGVEMNVPERIPCTLRPLAVTEWARERGGALACREGFTKAHWVEGGDIESDEVITRVAEQAEIDPGEALAAADAPELRARLAEIRREAMSRMVTGIPAFLFGSYLVIGCQPYSTMTLVAERLGIARRH